MPTSFCRRATLKNVEMFLTLFDDFWRFLTFFDVAPFCRPLSRSVNSEAWSHPNFEKQKRSSRSEKAIVGATELLSEFQGILGAALGIALTTWVIRKPNSWSHSQSDSQNWLEAFISAQILGALFSKLGWSLPQIHSLIHSFVRSFIHSFIHSFSVCNGAGPINVTRAMVEKRFTKLGF